MVESGEFAPVPTIEANVSPLEGTAHGTIVANASIPYAGIGVLSEPVVAKIKKWEDCFHFGRRSKPRCFPESLEDKGDPLVYNIAELGVGLNPSAISSGSCSRMKGVYGSVHIGIGTNITLGGTVKAACHLSV